MSAATTQFAGPLAEYDIRRLWQTLRSLVLPGRRKQLVSMLPVCVGASGLKPGMSAPDFTLPRVGGRDCSLSDSAGRRRLLVFVRPAHPHSRRLAADLNRIQRAGERQVLVILECRPHQAALWADDVLAAFPVLVPSVPDVARNYKVGDTPVAYEIDEQGRIAESGISGRLGLSNPGL